IQCPGRVECIDARPETGRSELDRLAQFDEPFARGNLRFDRDRVLEITEDDVDLADDLRDFRANLVDMRRDEMDHPFKPDRRFAQGRRSTDGERSKELAWQFHRHPSKSTA